MARKNSATGRTIASNGYVLIWKPDHPNTDARGYIYEHRLIASEKLGRPLLPGEIAHHNKNHDKTNNAPGNIMVISGIAEHRSLHRGKSSRLKPFGAGNPLRQCECSCGIWFYAYDKVGRPRKFVSGHNMKGKNLRKEQKWE